MMSQQVGLVLGVVGLTAFLAVVLQPQLPVELESLNPDVEHELGNPSWEDVGVRTGYSDPEPFFSAPEGSLAMGYGDGYEWPYVWSGQNLRGDSSGYDWEGAANTAQVRGLVMPPSNDVFGDIGPFDRVESPEARAYRVDSYETAVPMESLPLYRAAKSPRVTMLRTLGKQARLQSLGNSWTDYDMNGSPIKCTCDAAAAGDEEMEGLNPNVKPACSCTGGRVTQFTKTEEGGPLDTGAKGGWPQGIMDTKGVAYIDGGSQQAYKARPQILAQRPAHPVQITKKAFTVLRRLAEDGSDMLANEELEDKDGDESIPKSEALEDSEEEKSEEKEDEAAPKDKKAEEEKDHEESVEEDKELENEEEEDKEDQEDEDKEDQEDEDKEKEEEGADEEEDEEPAHEDDEEVEDEATVTAEDLAKDPKASAIDKELLGHFQRAFTSFLEAADGCDGTGACDESLCACERKAGRHMCYSLQAAFEDCPKSKLKVCELEALQEAKGLCKQVEKLPGVNVDNVPGFDEMTVDSGAHQKHFFFAPDGVYE